MGRHNDRHRHRHRQAPHPQRQAPTNMQARMHTRTCAKMHALMCALMHTRTYALMQAHTQSVCLFKADQTKTRAQHSSYLPIFKDFKYTSNRSSCAMLSIELHDAVERNNCSVSATQRGMSAWALANCGCLFLLQSGGGQHKAALLFNRGVQSDDLTTSRRRQYWCARALKG